MMEDKQEFLLELLCEEIPANMQKDAEAAYSRIFTDYFASHNLNGLDVSCDIGPRRVTIYVTNLPLQLPAKTYEAKGPSVKAPQKAIEGFARANNTSPDKLEVRAMKGQEYYFFSQKIPAKALAPLLSSTLAEPISKYVWPKSMYWGNYDIKWVRPLTSILCLFAGEIVPVKYGHLVASKTTMGHRFMANSSLQVDSIASYKEQLAASKVMLSRQERRDYIQKQLVAIAKANGLKLKEDNALLDEVTGLVEWPRVLLGKIDDKFLQLPPEVLVCSMRSHQKYFSCLDENGNFAPYFLFVTNIAPEDDEVIIKGNEQVLAARLSDGLYFYLQDQKTSLEEWRQKLTKITFHSKLGTLYAKTDRMAKLAGKLSDGDDNAILAAKLAKSDIPTKYG